MPSKTSNHKPKHKPLQPEHSWSFLAIGTHFWIGVYQPLEAVQWKNIQSNILGMVEDFDSAWSRFRPDSLVSRMASAAGEYTLPPEGDRLIKLYKELYDATSGLVTPLVGDLLNDLGYDAEYTLKPKKDIRSVGTWQESLSYDGDGLLTVKRPVLLDFGAAGKGYLVDMLSDLLSSSGIDAYCVDGSGDMRVCGVDPGLSVGIEHPGDSTMAVGMVQLSDGALCVSAPNRRQWSGLHHIVRPDTGRPVDGVATVCVKASSAAVADGLATALFMVSAEHLLDVFDFEYLVLYDDYSAVHSPGFPTQLYIKDEDK